MNAKRQRYYDEWIQPVAEGRGADDGENGEIVVDSGAEETVCPKNWGDQFRIDEAPPLCLRDASGNEIAHWGQRDVVVSSSF